MKIDPEKIDFDKMVPYQSLKNNNDESKNENNYISPVRSNYSNDDEGRQRQNNMEKEYAFAGEKLMSVFKLLALSWRMYKERWKKLVGLTLLSIVVGLIPSMISFILKLFGGNSSLFTVLEIVISLIFYISGMLIGIAVIEVMRDRNLGVFETISGSAKKLLSFFITGFIGALAMIAVLVANMIVILAGFLIFGFISSFTISLFGSDGVFRAFFNVTIWLFGFAAILLMLLPTLIASIWIYFAMFAVVLENMSPTESLSYGYELIKGKIISVIWKNIAVVILFVITSALLLIAVLIPSIIVPFLMVIAAIAMIPVVLVVIFIVSPVMYLFQYNIYENLKAIKKDKLPPDYAARYCGKIKALAVIGALIVILFILFSTISGFSFDKMKDGTDMPFGSYFQNKTGEKNNTSKKASNKETLSEIEKRDEQRISDLDSISLMLWRYKEKNGSYPVGDSVVKLNEDNDVVSGIKFANTGEEIPTDPMGKYYYGYESDGETYKLSAVLENKKDARCAVEGNLCIYRQKQVKVAQNEEELNLAAEDFSSPEATFNTHLKAFDDKNLDLYLEGISEKSKMQLEKLPEVYNYIKDINEWRTPKHELISGYRIVERNEEFAIMTPQFREQKGYEEDKPNEMFFMPDIYFEKEGGYWKISLFPEVFFDVKFRNEISDPKIKTEAIEKLKKEWKSKMKNF